MVDRAGAAGARVLLGGERTGAYFPPTVLTEVTPEDDAYRGEFFGPVAGGVPRQRRRRHPPHERHLLLAGSHVFTVDPGQAERVADRREAGMVYVNLVGADAPELPFGGTKRSGFGR